MRVSVFGQRNIVDEQKVLGEFDKIINKYDPTVTTFTFVHGGAKGPQELIYNYTKTVWDSVLYQPWTMISKKLSRLAMENGSFDPVYFFFRNIQILENSDLVVIFDNGEKDAEVYKVLSLCEKKNIPFIKVEI